MSLALNLDDLNEQQRIAVLHRGSPLLIVAGAGSGKTRVLTRRIANLVYTKAAYGNQILAITFTNKAAAEMRNRVEELVGPEARYMVVSTFHSASARFLRKDAEKLGYTKTFAIYDMDDAETLIKRVMTSLNLDQKTHRPRAVLHAISSAKNELISPSEFHAAASTYPQRVIADVYEAYQKKLLECNAMDFDDLIGNMVKLFKENPEVLDAYRARFRYILVDEYQDTNMAQYELIRLLAQGEGGGELCVVGDADQSIYAFRGATIRNIDEFERDFANAKVVLLEQNYRSTLTILNAANAVISKNVSRREKNLWTDAGDGEPIRRYTGETEVDESSYVASEISRFLKLGTFEFRDVVVMYRMNSQSRVLESAFFQAGIPYKVIGGTRFFERAEIKDALAYLRLIVNPADEVSLRRILNVPRRGIGDKAEELIADYAAISSLTMYDALVMVEAISGLQARVVKSINTFTEMFSNLRVLLEADTEPSVILAAVLEQSGYLSELEKSEDPKDESRRENLSQLEDFAREFELESMELAEDGSLLSFLEKVALISDSDQLADDERGQVTLMTLHTAKGLEFPVVFIVGLDEGVFPHSMSFSSPQELEEERRLAYVGITRAEKLLYLTGAEQRTIFGRTMQMVPSRFLAEIPEDLVMNLREGSLSRPVRTSKVSTDFISQHLPEGSAGDLKVGDMVRHEKFGDGRIVSIVGIGANAQVSVDFGAQVGQKRLLLRYSPVTKI